MPMNKYNTTQECECDCGCGNKAKKGEVYCEKCSRGACYSKEAARPIKK